MKIEEISLKGTVQSVLLLLLITILGACGEKKDDAAAGSPDPVAADLTCGVLASADATLTWTAPTTNDDGSSLTDLTGYKLYYGTTSGTYSSPIDVGNVLVCYAEDLTSGSTYYVAIPAYNSSNIESYFSVEKSITVP